MKNVVIILISIIALSSCGKKQPIVKQPIVEYAVVEHSMYQDEYDSLIANAKAFAKMAQVQPNDELKLKYLKQAKTSYESAFIVEEMSFQKHDPIVK